jgi:hypothetical protein
MHTSPYVGPPSAGDIGHEARERQMLQESNERWQGEDDRKETMWNQLDTHDGIYRDWVEDPC